ncbi:NAD(P)-binding protein [Wilcoxina mikolae CBS 423.85]|nr:NAD(P)-binding protein [Wilcoxina mikolae CBS 423.85]
MHNQLPSSSGSSSGSPSELSETILAILPFPEPKEIFDRIRQRHPKTTIIYFQPDATDIKIVEKFWKRDVDVPLELYEKATILLTLKTLPLPEQAPNLKLVHLFSSGIDHIVSHPLYTSSKTTITTSSGIHAPQITEHIFGTLLSLTHHIPRLLSWQRQHHWGSHSSSGGRTGLGMKVLAYTATPKPTEESRRDRGYIVPHTGDAAGEIPDEWYSGLDAGSRRRFLSQGIDVLVISVPLTPETRHFLGKDALVEALKGGGLAGASLDVTEPEPLGKDSELWDMENVIITPHVSGVGSEYKERCLEVLEMNLGRMERGEKLVNVVRRGRGY